MRNDTAATTATRRGSCMPKPFSSEHETPGDPRPSWDRAFFAIARTTAQVGADCTRSKVAAIIVDGSRRQLAQGYNGAVPGEPGCLSAGACPRGKHYEVERFTLPPFEVVNRHYYGSVYLSCVCSPDVKWPCPESAPPGSSYDTGPGACISIHAEQNAILDAGTKAVSIVGAWMYVTRRPCDACLRLLRAARLAGVQWPDSPGLKELAGSFTF